MTEDSTADSTNPFSSLGLDAWLISSLTALGYEEPTPIQTAAIPPLLAGRDLLGQAATGTGKTAAFALPLLQRIARTSEAERKQTSALVLVPTRELAIQVAEAVYRYGKERGVRVLPIYGGQPIERQLRGLKRVADVVVATPGRALDHLRRGSLHLDGVRTVVLDEADEMLDMGFAEDLEAILAKTPAERQTALFSATIPTRIAAIAARHLRDPAEARISRDTAVKGTIPAVRHKGYLVLREHKVATLARILDMEEAASALVFCRTRTETDTLTETLNGRGYRAEALHGGMSQEQRDRVMKQFRSGATELLIATDVAARGLDIKHLSHVVSYDVPSAPESYLHRVGRTGRAGREGVAILLVEPREQRLLASLEQLTKRKIEMTAIPTVAHLQARRLERSAKALRETLDGGELESFREVVQTLTKDVDALDVAAAALKLAHVASGRDRAEEEIPTPPPRKVKARGLVAKSGGQKGVASHRRRGEWKTAHLYIDAGRAAGIRPADLVGAIANESGLESRVIGAIKIEDTFSRVEVPEELVDELVKVLRGLRLKGKRVTVKRDRP